MRPLQLFSPGKTVFYNVLQSNRYFASRKAGEIMGSLAAVVDGDPAMLL